MTVGECSVLGGAAGEQGACVPPRVLAREHFQAGAACLQFDEEESSLALDFRVDFRRARWPTHDFDFAKPQICSGHKWIDTSARVTTLRPECQKVSAARACRATIASAVHNAASPAASRGVGKAAVGINDTSTPT